MGMLDNSTKFATAEAVTSTGDTTSTNYVDTGNVIGSDLAISDNMWLQAIVSTTATSGGSATVQAVLQDSADASSWADVIAGPAVAVANATAGTALMLVKPPMGMRRYIRIVWRVGTAALTAGAFTAYLSADVQRNIARPSGFTVA